MFFFLLPTAIAAQNPFRSEITPVQIMENTRGGNLEVLIAVPEGFHLYIDMMGITATEPQGVQFLEPVYPTGIFQPDPANSALFREHYEDTVRISFPFTLANIGSHWPKIEVRYQGCKGGLCYKPATDIHTVSVSKVSEEKKKSPIPTPAPTPLDFKVWSYFGAVDLFPFSRFSSQTPRQ